MADYFYSLAAIFSMNVSWDNDLAIDNGLFLLRLASEENQ